jgi:hypothetical protein
LVELGRSDQALERLGPLRLASSRLDPWVLSARAALEVGRIDDMKRFLGGARERTSGGYAGNHRKELHTGLLCGLTALLGRPQPGPGAVGVACGWMGGTSGADIVSTSERSLLISIIRSMVLAGHAPLVERLLEPEAERALPGIVGLVKHAVAELGMRIEERG